MDAFLKNAYLPAMHQAGIKNIGVFKPLETDSTYGKRIFILIPYNSLEQFSKISDVLFADKQFNLNGKEYLDAVYSNPPYVRIDVHRSGSNHKFMSLCRNPDTIDRGSHTPLQEKVIRHPGDQAHLHAIAANPP